MTSRPLFIRVAESTVILGPMVHVGWASASFTEAFDSSSRLHSRKGPPDAVMTTRLRSSLRSPRRHCASAACSESTGINRSGSPFTRSMTSSPPTMSDSLLARASVFPDCSAASDGAKPTAPTMAFSTMSASDSRAMVSAASVPARISMPRIAPSPALISRAASSSAIATSGGRNSRICPTSSSWLVAAASATTLNRSGLRRTTSSACVPIDPVEPRIATARIGLPERLPRPATIWRSRPPYQWQSAPEAVGMSPERHFLRRIPRLTGVFVGFSLLRTLRAEGNTTRQAARTGPNRCGRARRRAPGGGFPCPSPAGRV